MEDLKNKLVEGAVVTSEQAEKAIEIISEYIKKRVPPVVHGQLDKILQGHSLEENIKNQLGDIGNDIKTKAEGLAKDLQNSFEKAFGNKK
jgi:hypothetical protein